MSDIEVVASAATPQDALRLSDEHAPEAAVVDVRMPGVEGAELLAALRERRPDMGLVAYSSSAGAMVGRQRDLGIPLVLKGELPRSRRGAARRARTRPADRSSSDALPSSTVPSSMCTAPLSARTWTTPRMTTPRPKVTSPSTVSARSPTSEGGPAGKRASKSREQLVVAAVEVHERRSSLALGGEHHARRRSMST